MFARVSAPLSVHASVLTHGVRRKAKYDESPMTKSPTERTVTVIPPTRARTSKRPYKWVSPSLRNPVLLVIHVGVEGGFIRSLLTPVSCSYMWSIGLRLPLYALA